MQIKQYKRYHVNFKSKWIQPCAMLMGLSFFLRVFYYFGFRFVSDWSFWDVIFQILLPLVFAGVFTMTLWTLHRDIPGFYGLIGAGFCILIAIWSFYSGNFLYMLLCIVYYIAACAVFLTTSMGLLPGKLLSTVMLSIPVVIRIFTIKPFSLGLSGLCLEFSVITLLGSLACFTRSLTETNKRK